MSLLDPPFVLRESFGTKLRRLARVAEVSNPLVNTPWIIPPAWVATTAYTQGNVVSNGGSWFVCTTNGTSAGAGGPTIITDGDSHADGTTAWTYIGGPTLTASDANAPTYTTSTASTPTGLTNWFGPVAYPGVFKVTGGYATTFATLYWKVFTFDQASGNTAALGSEISFETESPKIAVGFTNGSNGVRVAIDGRYYSVSSLLPATGATPNWEIFDFSSTSGRRKRSVVVEGGKAGLNFAGVRVGPLDQVWAPTTQDDVRAVFISDSLMAGSAYGPWISGGSVPQRVGKLLGWSDCWNMSIGSTGYIATATGTRYTYGQRITEALTRTPDLWVFMGSTNDIGQTSAAITAAALAVFQAIRAGGSRAPIIVLGVWPLNNASVSTVETAVQAAVTAFADTKTYYIPIYADSVLPWVTGAWNNTANTSSVNAPMYIAGDATHPADIGTSYLSQRIAKAIRTLVLPNIL